MPSTTSRVVSRRLGLFDRDDAFLADLLHRLGDACSPISLSPFAVIVPTWAISFGSLVCFAELLERRRRRRLDGLVDAALDLHRVVPGGDELRALAVDRLREDRRRRRAVAGDVGRLRGDLLDHLRAHVLEAVLELDLLGDRDAVLGDRRGAELFSMTTLRPLGPRVTLTASASCVDAARGSVASGSA